MANPYTMNPARMSHHRDELRAYLGGADIMPITLEFSPSAACNHNCWWCSSGYSKEQNQRLGLDVVQRVLDEAAGWGCKAVIWSGGGEPLVNRYFPEMLAYSHGLGLDNGIHTNLSTSDRGTVRTIAECATWVRVSAEAADRETYKAIHGREHFDRMCDNLRQLIVDREAIGRVERLVVGAQIVVTVENQHQIAAAKALYKDIGINYLQIHPVTFNPELEKHWVNMDSSLTRLRDDHSPDWYEEVYASLLPMEDEFLTIKHDQWKRCISDADPQPFSKCFATFSPFIEGDGNVYYCPDTKRQEKFALGNVNKDSFVDIWRSEKRRKIVGSSGCGASNIDVSECHKVCVKRPMNIFLAEQVEGQPSAWSELSSLWGDVAAPTPHRNFV